MRIFTATFCSALIIFGAVTAEVIIGHIEQGKFKAEEVYCIKKHQVSNAFRCIELLKSIKNTDWRLK